MQDRAGPDREAPCRHTHRREGCSIAGLRKDAVREKLNALLTAARAQEAEQEAELRD